ncbi:MAG TPA: methyltransferase domain-containing protein [Miltoncostaeaceae bacterium]|nr:methyltransferase domain-containing protein [Miltoncostaeaceae bacterium]
MPALDVHALLVCPACRGALGWNGAGPRCEGCDVAYGVQAHIPVLFPVDGSTGAAEQVYDPPPPSMLDRLPRPVRGPAQRLRARLQPSLVHQSPGGRRRIHEFVASLPPGATVVNVGAGATDYGPNVLNLDVFPASTVHALATSERLPLSSGAVDGVILEAVLEHVRDADATLLEIMRVLRPGGRVLIDVPFLQPYHPSPGDYRRYTEQGLRTRLEQLGFDVGDSGVSVGPASAMAWIGSHFAAMLVSVRSDRVYRGARIITDLLFLPLKYADNWLDRHPRATLIASGVWCQAGRPADGCGPEPPV